MRIGACAGVRTGVRLVVGNNRCRTNTCVILALKMCYSSSIFTLEPQLRTELFNITINAAII